MRPNETESWIVNAANFPGARTVRRAAERKWLFHHVCMRLALVPPCTAMVQLGTRGQFPPMKEIIILAALP